MSRISKREIELSAELSAIDSAHVFEDHYVRLEEKGRYGEVIEAKPPASLMIRIPWVFSSAPQDVTREVLEYAFARVSVPQKALYGPLACDYLSRPETIKKLRVSIARVRGYTGGACPLPKVANKTMHTCKKLLGDYSEVMDEVTMKWRTPDCESKKPVSSDYVAKVAVFDSDLLSDSMSKPLRDYVMFREMCTFCAFSLKRNAVLKWKFELLLHRFPGWQHMEEMCKKLGWKFTVKP